MVLPEITAHVDRLEKDIVDLVRRFQIRCSNWHESVEVQSIQFTPAKTNQVGVMMSPEVKIEITIKGKNQETT